MKNGLEFLMHIGIGHTSLCFYFPSHLLKEDSRWDIAYNREANAFILSPGKLAKYRLAESGGWHGEIGVTRHQFTDLSGKTLAKTKVRALIDGEQIFIVLPEPDTWKPCMKRGKFRQDAQTELPISPARETTILDYIQIINNAVVQLNQIKQKFPQHFGLIINHQGTLSCAVSFPVEN